MNKIYRLVWNRETGTMVVASEFAKSDGGRTASALLSSPRLTFNTLAAAVLLSMAGQAIAADGQKYPVSGSNGDNYCYYDAASETVICGDNTTRSENAVAGKPAKSVVFGIGATNTGESNVAIGIKSQSAETASIAIGSEAKALHNQSVAIGQNAEAHSDWDISIGRRAGSGIVTPATEGRNIAIGDGALERAVSPNNNIVMGTSAASELTGNASVILGTYANSKTANKEINGIDSGVNASNVVAIGDRALATTNSAVAIGNRVKASGSIATAVGASANASGAYSISNGYGATSSGSHSIAIGSAQNQTNKTQATQNFSIAIGSNQTAATGVASIAIGTEAKAQLGNTIAVGKNATASAIEAVAIGRDTQANKTGAIAMGQNSQATGISSTAVGLGTQATGNQSAAFGATAAATADQAMAIGYHTIASAQYSTALGNTATATALHATALGSGAKANGANSIAAGSGTATGGSSVAIGRVSKSYTGNDIAIGSESEAGVNGGASSSNAIAVGRAAKATQVSTVAIGNGAKAEATNSIALGTSASVNNAGAGSIALGSRSSANGVNATAIGQASEAAGQNAFAGGQDSHAVGKSSVAVGDGARSSEDSATAVGAYTKATGAGAGAFGFNANASAYHGLALGANSVASAGSSVAIGSDANASLEYGVALGSLSKTEVNAGVEGADPLSAGGAKTTPTWTSTRAAVSVGDVAGGITRQITGVAAGTKDTDAVNVAQLKAAGFKLATSKSGSGEVQGDTLEKVQNGETLTIDAGDNIKLIQAANKITVAVNAQKTVEDAHSPVVYTNANGDRLYKHTDGNFYTTKDGTGNPVDPPDVIASMQNAIGQTNYPMTLANVAPGALNDKSTQAVNGSQLFATNQNVATNAENIAKGIHVGGTTGSNQYALGDTINIKGDSNISSSTVAGGVQLALAPVLNVGPAAGGKPVKIDGNAGTVGGLSNTTFDPNNVTSGQAATEDQLKAVNDKAVAAKTKVDAGDNIEVASTTNVDGSTTYTVATKKDVVFDKVTVGGVTIDKSTNKVSGLAAGELSATSTDAVNGSQLHATNQNVATNATNIQTNADNIAKGINVGGTTGSNQYALGDTINIKGDSNISSSTVAGGVQLALAPVLSVGPATGGNPVKIDGNAGTVSGLSNTTFDPNNVTSGQAATEDQLKAVNDKAVAAKTKVDAGDNIEVASTTNADGSTTYTVATKKDVSFDSVTVGGNTLDDNGLAIAGGPIISVSGIDMAGKKISNLADGTEDGDAVNFSQLKAVQTLVNAGWTVTDASGNAAKIGPNGVVTFSSADSNISVVQNGADQAGKVEITLNRNLDLDSVTAGGNKLDANGLAIAGGPTISATGIDMGGKKISNLGDGTEEGDAVNLGQLKSYVGEETAKVKTHYYSVNDGGTKGGNYDNDGATGNGAIAAGVDTTATAENAVAMGKGAAASHAGSVALGAGAQTQAVDNTGTFMLNGGTAAGVNAVAVVSVGSKGNERRIVNVAAGRLSADSTDAVNGSQLFAVGTAVNNLGNATALALGGNTTYTPGGGLSVNLTVGGNTYTNVQDALNAVSGGGTGATKVVAGTNTQVTQNGDTYTVSVVDNPVVDGKATFNGGIEVAGGQSVNMGGNVVRNVAAGVADTDAVNVGQLNGAIAGANAYTDGRFNQLANDMWQIDRGYRGATASAMAMAGLPQAYLPGKSMFSAAVGGYRGEYGLAFGLSGITDNGKWVYKAQASGNTARDWGFSAGVGVQW